MVLTEKYKMWFYFCPYWYLCCILFMKKVLLHNTPNDKVRENASFLSLVMEKSGKSQEISIKVVCMNPDQL